MTTTNVTAPDPNLDACILAAKSAYAGSKDGAMKAAAAAYRVYRLTENDVLKEWMDTQIKSRNEAITAHNERVDARRKAVETYKKDIEQGLKPTPSGTVEADLKLKSEDWKQKRKVKVEARNGASAFSSVTKFLFEFDSPDQAPLASRYVQALEWLHRKFDKVAIDDQTPLSEAMSNVGGFEAAILEQRRFKQGDAQSAGDLQVIDLAVNKKIKDAVANAGSKGSIKMQSTVANDSLVFMVGRQDGDDVRIVGEIALKDHEINGLLRKMEDKDILTTNPRVEWVSRVLALGSLVENGAISEKTVAGLTGGEPLEEKRMLWASPSDSGSELVVSARNVTASVIVKAIPTDPVIQSLLAMRKVGYMRSTSLKQMTADLQERARRTFCDLDFDDAPKRADGSPSASPYGWVLVNDALVQANRPTGHQTLFWHDMANTPDKPLDVHGYNPAPQLTVELSREQVETVIAGCLSKYASVTNEKKSTKPMSITLGNGEVIFEYSGQKPFNASVAPKVSIELTKDLPPPPQTAKPAGERFKVRPSDALAIFSLLQKLMAAKVTISGDTAGMVSLSYEDDLGEYTIYLPCCDDKLQLVYRCCQTMRLPSPTPVPIAAQPAELVPA